MAHLQDVSQQQQPIDAVDRLHQGCLLGGHAQHVDAAQRAQVQV
jgi:hypothetical protein